MDGQTWGNYRTCVFSALRAELVRLGITKADFDRKGISMEDLDREALRMFGARRGQGAGVVRELLGRAGFAPPR
ncbi:MAG TPA: hypothetical protein VIJ36_02515 [Thermoanaerobaculia bacterium]